MRWSEFANHTFVKQPKDLTARSTYCPGLSYIDPLDDTFSVWTNIRPALVAFMEKNKTLRLKEERLIILAKRHRLLVYLRKDYDSTRPVYEITPGVADIAGMEPFRTIIEDSSVDDEVGADSFAQAMTELPRLAQEWKKSKDEELLEIISKDSTFFSDPTNTDLTLATTFFKCPVCQEPLSYPRVLAHSHLTLPLPYHPWKNEESEQTALFAKLSETPWNFGGRLSFFNDAYMAARGVVKACGLDPGAATASEMDELDPFVECLLCKNTGRQIMRWKRAVCPHFIRWLQCTYGLTRLFMIYLITVRYHPCHGSLFPRLTGHSRKQWKRGVQHSKQCFRSRMIFVVSDASTGRINFR